MEEHKVIVITGTAGVGKTTIAHYLTERYQIPQVVTHTTRAPRSGEIEGKDYYFENDASFHQKHYLESVSYAGAFYGSSLEALDIAWRKNRLVSIVLDTAGAISYLQKLPQQTVVVFVAVSNPNLARQRLHQRQDAAQANHQRINSKEFKRDIHLPEALNDKAQVVINDDWALTRNKLDQLVKFW